MKRDFNEFLNIFLNSFPSKFIADYLHISSVAVNGYIRDHHTVLSGAKRRETNSLSAKGDGIDTPETYDVGSRLPLETVKHGCGSPCNLEHNAIAVTRHGSTTRSEGKNFLNFLAYNCFFK